MKYSEILKTRTEEKWTELSPPEANAPRGFDITIILTIVQAVMGFLSSCRNPQPVPAAARGKKLSAREVEDHTPNMVGLKMRLRNECRQQHGRGWRQVWQEQGDKMLATAKAVATDSTHEEVEGLRAEARNAGIR